ncbi:hypothetical protein [Actinotalea solisilvae]|uniref:hypothetical protein n=1 Tax=Actinotalea solisilvae TaxID=2072922 RepID=UPI0018F11262|nr:hypothetical protein [Actinotalea solisilvae]
MRAEPPRRGAGPAAATTPEPGPSLATLTQRLALTGPDLLAPEAEVPALVADVALVLDGTVLGPATLQGLDVALGRGALGAARAAAGVVCWLLSDPAVRSHPGVQVAARARGGLTPWFLHVLHELSTGLSAERDPRTWVHEGTGREEAARAVCAAGGLLPDGETAAQAADRWQAVSTAYRRQASRAMAEEVRRAEELARALAEKRAKEAAAQYANY